MITARNVRSLFSYNPRTGVLSWREPGKGRNASLVAGVPDPQGYIVVGFQGRSYQAHRVIWLLKKGRWPSYDIDHKDGNPSNNKWGNLREATRRQNAFNQRIRKNNKSGFKGVRWHKECKGWCAHIYFRKKRIWLGAHATPELASAAYMKAAKKYFGEFART